MRNCYSWPAAPCLLWQSCKPSVSEPADEVQGQWCRHRLSYIALEKVFLLTQPLFDGQGFQKSSRVLLVLLLMDGMHDFSFSLSFAQRGPYSATDLMVCFNTGRFNRAVAIFTSSFGNATGASSLFCLACSRRAGIVPLHKFSHPRK